MRNETDSKPFFGPQVRKNSKASSALYFSIPLLINFPLHALFFLLEQCVSLRLPLSVLSEIIISWNQRAVLYQKSNFM